jgi:hypothetical protein
VHLKIEPRACVRSFFLLSAEGVPKNKKSICAEF